jgi:hypothetical protein
MNGLRLQEVFQHLTRTWEALRLADLDLPLARDLRQLHDELSAASDHLGNNADLATFGWKCAKFGAGLQEATIRLFLPAQFQEQLDDLAGEFRVNDIRMEERLDRIEQRLHEDGRETIPRLRRKYERLRDETRVEIRELQGAVRTQADEIITLQHEIRQLQRQQEFPDEGPRPRRYVRNASLVRDLSPRRRSPTPRHRSPTPRREGPRHRDDSREPQHRREDSPRHRRRDSRPRHRSAWVRSRRHHRDESREPRRRHHDETPKPRRMIELSPPPEILRYRQKGPFRELVAASHTIPRQSASGGRRRRQAQNLMGLIPPRSGSGHLVLGLEGAGREALFHRAVYVGTIPR